MTRPQLKHMFRYAVRAVTVATSMITSREQHEKEKGFSKYELSCKGRKNVSMTLIHPSKQLL